MKLHKNFFSLLTLGLAISLADCAQIDKEDTSSKNPNVTAPAPGTPAPIEGIYAADTVPEAPGHTGTGTYNSASITNGVRGGGLGGGATSGIFSLDNAPAGASTHIVIAWLGKKVKNGTGADFAIYENAFNISGNPATRFMDLAFVEVSNDNINYCGFAPDYTNATETAYSNNPANWLRFAGRTPVVYNVDVPATNYTAAQLFQDNDANYEGDLGGGDLFDLDLLSDNNYYNTGCTTALRDELKTNGFTYLKLVPAKRRINPDTGALFVADGVSSGPDFDGVVARYVQ